MTDVKKLFLTDQEQNIKLKSWCQTMDDHVRSFQEWDS